MEPSLQTFITTQAYINEHQLKEFGIAVVAETSGSTARKAGALLTCTDTGNLIAGSIGGGETEQQCLQRLTACIAQGQVELFTQDSRPGTKNNPFGQVCGGRQLIVLNGRGTDSIPALEQAIRLQEQGQSGVLITVIHHPDIEPGTVFYVAEQEIKDTRFPVPQSVLRKVLTKKKCFLHREEKEIFCLLYPVISPRKLLIIGGGHCGRALAELGKWAGFQVTVMDILPEPADWRFDKKSIKWLQYSRPETISTLGIDAQTCIAIMTRDHRGDAYVLQACLQTEAGYIGMIGSRNKTAVIKAWSLQDKWATEQDWQRVHAPIGLDIHAEDVREIAVSIMAEIIQTVNS
jgi:xanthine dehydrogenase accessory factor